MSLAQEPLDVLVSGDPGPRHRAALAAGLVVLLVLAAAGWFLDLRSRQAEDAALMRCAAAAAVQVGREDSQVSATADYVRPGLSFASPHSADGLYQLVAHAAARALPGLRPAYDRCAGLRVRGWHSRQRAALSAQIAYLDAWRARLEDTRTDGRAFFGDESRLVQLLAAANSAAAAADSTWPG